MPITIQRIGWEDEPSEATPIDSGNLKAMEDNTEKAINELEKKETEEDFTSKISFLGDNAANSRFYKKGNMVFGYYQAGQVKRFANNDTLFTIPEGYRPMYEQNFYTFVINAGQYGIIIINNNGEAKISQISSGTINGRVYFNFFYLVNNATDIENLKN